MLVGSVNSARNHRIAVFILAIMQVFLWIPLKKPTKHSPPPLILPLVLYTCFFSLYNSTFNIYPHTFEWKTHFVVTFEVIDPQDVKYVIK